MSPTTRIATIPNLLTLLRFLLIPVFVLASVKGAFTIAFFAFVIAGITDAVDGYVARKLNQQSRLGALIDPAVDKLMMISGYVVFTMPHIATYRLPIWLTFTVFARDVCIVFFAYLLFTRIRAKKFPPSIPGKVSTVCQVVALSITIAANTFLAPLAVPLLDLALKVTFVMTLYSGYHYLKTWNAVVMEQES